MKKIKENNKEKNYKIKVKEVDITKNILFIIFFISLTIACVTLLVSNIFLFKKNDELRDALVIAEKKEYVKNKVYYDQNDYNYLAIGNSITKHPICDYWWSERGMAATEDGKDYYSLVSDYIKEKYKKSTSRAVSFTTWELQWYDRYEVLSLLDKYLDQKLNLITIQLSENVHDRRDQFKKDYKELIDYIKSKCPYTKIILIDDFFDKNNHTIKKELAKEMDLGFADLTVIFGNEEYQIGNNAEVKDSDGRVHKIDSAGVAVHPGDKGMRYIADKVIELIK